VNRPHTDPAVIRARAEDEAKSAWRELAALIQGLSLPELHGAMHRNIAAARSLSLTRPTNHLSSPTVNATGWSARPDPNDDGEHLRPKCESCARPIPPVRMTHGGQPARFCSDRCRWREHDRRKRARRRERAGENGQKPGGRPSPLVDPDRRDPLPDVRTRMHQKKFAANGSPNATTMHHAV
jgi:hypothetical protein